MGTPQTSGGIHTGKNAKGDLFCAAAFRPAAAGPDAAWTLTVQGGPEPAVGIHAGRDILA